MKKPRSLSRFGLRKTRLISQPKPAFARHHRIPRGVEAALLLIRQFNLRYSSL